MNLEQFRERFNLQYEAHQGNKPNVYIVYNLTLEDFHNTMFQTIKPEYKIFWLDHNPIPQIRLTYRLSCGTAIDVERHGIDIAFIVREPISFDEFSKALVGELDYYVDVSHSQQNIFITAPNKPLFLTRDVNLIAERMGFECAYKPIGDVNDLRLPNGDLVYLSYGYQTVYDKRLFGLLIQFPTIES